MDQAEQLREELVPVTRLQVPFSDAQTLEGIADTLMSQGRISGCRITPAIAHHAFKGKKVTEEQFILTILLSRDDSELVQSIQQFIADRIRKAGWEVPDIEKDDVEVPPSMLKFMINANNEHRLYIHSRRIHRISMGVAVAIIAVLGGWGVSEFSQRRHAQGELQGRSQAMREAYENMSALSRALEIDMNDARIGRKESLSRRLDRGYRIIRKDERGKSVYGWVMEQEPGEEESASPHQLYDIMSRVREAEHAARIAAEGSAGK